jgi:hypothetical protein
VFRWETINATDIRLEIDGDPDPNFPRAPAGTYSATITGSADVELIATNAAGEDRRELRIASRAPEVETNVDLEIDVALTGVFSQNPERLGPSLDFALRVLFLRFEMGGFAVFPPNDPEVTRGGTTIGAFQVWSLGGLLRAGLCLDPTPFSICALVGPGVELVRASTTVDPLFVKRVDFEARPIVGMGLRVDLSFGWFRLYFRGETILRPSRVELKVDGADRRYLDSRAAAFLSLGAAVQVF